MRISVSGIPTIKHIKLSEIELSNELKLELLSIQPGEYLHSINKYFYGKFEFDTIAISEVNYDLVEGNLFFIENEMYVVKSNRLEKIQTNLT